MAALPIFTPGFRLIDGSDLNAAFATAGLNTVIMPVAALAGLVNAQVRKIAISGSFKVTGVGFRVGTPATTAAKLATLTTQINGVALTGGVIALTSANCTPSGALVAGSAITAKNLGANTTLEIAVSAVTAFVEGDGWVEFTLQRL